MGVYHLMGLGCSPGTVIGLLGEELPLGRRAAQGAGRCRGSCQGI
jgi:hypothetical protein